MGIAAIQTRLGPRDHGRPMSLAEFDASRFREGRKYELIDGKVYVTHLPELPEDLLEKWLFLKLWVYSGLHPAIINHVTDKARVFVPSRRQVTVPEPDLAAYHNFPKHLAHSVLRWRDVSPILVGEIMSRHDPKKDLVRNVELYLQVPSIKEYWLLDGRKDPDRPTIRVHRRHGKRWRIIELAYGDTYTTKLLPGFALTVDPHT